MTRLNRFLSVSDFERAAARRLPRCVFEYVRGGTEDERSLQNNAAAFGRYRLRPRGLQGVVSRQQSVTLWGQRYAMPLGLAPTGLASMIWHECDLELAREAAAAQIPFIISGSSSVPLERLQKAAPGCWYQAYFPGDRERIERIVQRLEAARVEVLVVTIDTCVAANRENNARVGFTIPFRMTPRLMLDGLLHPRWSLGVFIKTLRLAGVPRFANLYEEIGPPITQEPAHGFRTGRDALTWEHMRWLRERWRGRLVIKGVLHPQDAEMAARIGADAIIVSNHGGRQLDSAASTLEVLQDVVAAAPVDFPVLIDGGFRRGTDVLKALTLGARMVFVGRATLYGAAVAGGPGVKRVLDILRSEIDRNLALLGCGDLQSLTPDLMIDQLAGSGGKATEHGRRQLQVIRSEAAH